MTTTNKTFDCVEMKRHAQESLLREFHSRRQEFDSLAKFLNAKVLESEQTAAIWGKLSSGESRGPLPST
jgi:hypothetical protein